MRLLIYGINYAPELTGIGKYTGEMGAWLAENGHEVTVIAAPPYYPEWEIQAAYRNQGWRTETREGVRVHRCPLYVPRRVTSAKRILHELSFVLSSLVYWLPLLIGKKMDVVICPAPPFHLGVLPVLYGKLRGVPVVTHIQDLQVDAAKELGMIRNNWFLNLMFGVEQWILRHSQRVSTISEGMRAKVLAKGITASNVVLFPNWVDETQVYPLPPEQSLRGELGLSPAHRVVLYAGNLGEKQGLESIVAVAAAFRHRPDLIFVVVGSGGGKEKLQALVTERELTNVRFFPLQPYEKLSALLATADLHLVLQKKNAADLVMPSKLTGILAAGGCALVTALPGTSLYEVVQQHELGILVEPESVEALYEGIDRALQSDLSRYRTNARAYAQRYLRKEAILRAFEEELQGLVGRQRP
jgi:colanic acid biosynthesis glycosyl transferase WcaI